jgi:hypothetical protein
LQSTAIDALVLPDAQRPQQVAFPPGPQRFTASASSLGGIGSGEAIITATEPVSSSSAATGEQTNATGAQAFSTSPSIRSLDGKAVAALFDDAEVFEWLADSRQSQSSPSDGGDSLTTGALSDDLLSTIGQQWHS